MAHMPLCVTKDTGTIPVWRTFVTAWRLIYFTGIYASAEGRAVLWIFPGNALIVKSGLTLWRPVEMLRRKLMAALSVGVICCSFALAQNTHTDAFGRDGASDARLVKEVRHQLVMLPYYSVFDDLAFRISGDTVT